MSEIRVAVVQAAPAAFELEATLERMRAKVAKAAAQGAALVLFPEAYVGGYPKGHDFGVVVGSRSDAGREWFARYAAGAVELDDATDRAIGAMAKAHGVHLITGVIERDGGARGGTLYCSVFFYAPTGDRVAIHRKLVPTAAERVVWARGDGSTLPVVQTGPAKSGAVICWENYMPLLRTTMYAKGVELYCAPTVDARDSWIWSMRHIAAEGRCFVLSCCQFATRADYPADYATAFGDDPSTVLIRGGSCIVGPMGELIAEPIYDREAVLVETLDLSALARARMDLDPTGHYARPDIFELRVDERERPRLLKAD